MTVDRKVSFNNCNYPYESQREFTLDRVINICLMEATSWWLKAQAIKFNLFETEFDSPSAMEAYHNVLEGSYDGPSIHWQFCLSQNVSRVPFATTAESIGLGPPAVRPGDVVVIIKGANVPYVSRESTQDQWKLIGPTYVEYIMFGESLKGGYVDRDFFLE